MKGMNLREKTEIGIEIINNIKRSFSQQNAHSLATSWHEETEISFNNNIWGNVTTNLKILN